jgi:hypothetical protein
LKDKTAEQLWKDPDWTCPRCKSSNIAVRGKCRSCGFDSALVSGGVCLEATRPESVAADYAEWAARAEATLVAKICEDRGKSIDQWMAHSRVIENERDALIAEVERLKAVAKLEGAAMSPGYFNSIVERLALGKSDSFDVRALIGEVERLMAAAKPDRFTYSVDFMVQEIAKLQSELATMKDQDAMEAEVKRLKSEQAAHCAELNTSQVELGELCGQIEQLQAALSVETKALKRFACFALEENDLRIMMISLSAKGLSDADRDYRIEYGKIREETQAALAEPTITLEAARIRAMEEVVEAARLFGKLGSMDAFSDDIEEPLRKVMPMTWPTVADAERLKAKLAALDGLKP